MVPLRSIMVEGKALELDGETIGNHVIFSQKLKRASEIYIFTIVHKRRERLTWRKASDSRFVSQVSVQ